MTSYAELYPEHERLAGVRERSQAQGELLEWLLERSVVLCRWDDKAEEFQPWPTAGRGIEVLLAEMHGIDLHKIEAEKQQMLDQLRAMDGAR